MKREIRLKQTLFTGNLNALVNDIYQKTYLSGVCKVTRYKIIEEHALDLFRGIHIIFPYNYDFMNNTFEFKQELYTSGISIHIILLVPTSLL